MPTSITIAGLLTFATAAVASIVPPGPAPLALDQPAYERPAAQWRDIEDANSRKRHCRDAVRRVRAESGLPDLDRRPASPEEPLFVKAVDQRIEGCPALVMARDTSDVRPVPEIEQNPALLIPAN
ncbi:hypothetical protein [Qipengyuania sp. MTN3-11]|uniref:hypothetical protein n=1 Tax=Qipengyuania sp. MTN3-11 TaxID=3056557 RepID=UPI0036F294D7